MKTILRLAIGIIVCMTIFSGCTTGPPGGGGKSLEKYYSESVDQNSSIELRVG